MLGAYRPQMSVMESIGLNIEKVYLRLSQSKSSTDVPAIVGDWFKNNANALVNMIMDDFNSRVNLPRGPAVVPSTGVAPYAIEGRDTAAAAYFHEPNKIVFGTIPFERLKNKYYKEIQAGEDNPVRSDIFSNLMVASNTVSTVYHETLHRIQMYHAQAPRPYEDLLTSISAFQSEFFPYPYNTIEMPTFAINASSFLACTTPPKLYALSDAKSIVRYAYSRKLALAFKSSMLDSFNEGLDTPETKVRMDKVIAYSMNRIVQATNQFYAHQLMYGTTDYDKYIDHFTEMSRTPVLRKQVMNLQKLFNKNLNRMIRDYDAVNRAMAKYIPEE